MSKNMNKPLARKDNIVIQKLENETLVYDLKENKAFCLNETSAIVWELCDGNRTATEMSDEMSKKLKTRLSEELVYLALDQLGKDGLLDSDTPDYFGRLSRREVIRKVGFASVVALPMISSLVAPEASMAQSVCTGINLACSPGDCCPGDICLSFGFPATCCVGTATSNRPGGTTHACQPLIASPTQANCDAGGPVACCSGSSTIAVSAGTNGCAPDAIACICNP